MRKAIVIVIFLGVFGMIGWSAYDYLSSDTKENDFDGALLVADPDDQDGEGSDEFGLERDKKAPDFELKTLDGDTAKLSDYRGQRVIVNFWATWCPPCREEIPDFKKLYDEKDVEILAVNMTDTETDMDYIEEFVHEKFEMPFPVLLDESGELAQTYKIAAYPTSYMIDSEGKVQFVGMGAMTYDQMVEQLDKLD